jgi:hypothetical protein
MLAKTTLLAALLAAMATPALAQGSGILNVLGVVDKVDATAIFITDDEGGSVESFRLAPDLLVVRNKPATLADIKPNDFVASAAAFGPDHKLHSTELRIFPEAMRGVGEGQRPMNDPSHQTMTNATVTGAAIVNGSNTVTVKFDGGQSSLIVDPGVPVTRIDVASISDLKSGVKVRMRGTHTADGNTVNRITIQ